MSRQIGHFRFPDQPEDASLYNVRAASPIPGSSQKSAVADEQSIEPHATKGAVRALARTQLGAAIAAATELVLLLLSAAPFYQSAVHHQSVHEACHNLTGSDYNACANQTLGGQARAANLHWNAWGSWLSWPGIVLFLIVATVVAFKAAFSKSEKVVLSRQIRLALFLADLLFLVSIFHIPHDNAGRAWGLWLSLVCVIAINVGILLANTDFGEWIAEHWPKRAKQPATHTEPMQQPLLSQQTDYRPTPQAMPPGHRQPTWPPPVSQQPFQQFPPSDQR